MTKPDTVDQKIGLLVAELVDLAPLPPPLPDGDAVRRWRERRRRRLAVRSLTAACAAAVAGAAAAALALSVAAGVTESPHWALAGDITSAWRQVPGIGPTSGFALTCPSATTCYAEGPGAFDPGPVEVTRDGGKTWQAVPTKGGTPLSNVACSSARECAFLEAPLSGQPVLLQTANAGKTWVSRPGPPGLSGDSIGSVALSCPSASTCTVVASSFQQTGTSGAFVTEDGGRTWSASPMPTAWPSQVQCFPNARCISTGAGAPGGPLGASYSTDSGLHWAPAVVPSALGALVHLSCSSPETCMALSWSYGAPRTSLVISGNGGEAWSTVQAQGLPAGKVFTALACPTASVCWVSGNTPLHLAGGRVTVGGTGGGAVLSSTDGGRTWLSAALPKGITGIGPLSCPNPSTCFALAFKTRLAPSSGAPRGPLTFALLAYTK
ncbi:MAG TPA: hypothetical protein VME46_22325 [Acidimicrobiales bacterium]|nr:hypothetical protein [Acidimicrobiales bacterium]